MSSDPLVLLPPILCDARVFGPQLAALTSEFAVMCAPTTRGERMEEIASQILGWAPPRFALAGMSMGGAVALEILRRAPERVARVALISASHHGETPEGASAREPKIVAARSGRYDDVISQELSLDWLSPSAPRTEIGHLISDMAHSQGAEAYVRQARAMQRRRDQQATLRKIDQSTLVICGEDDSHLPVKRHEFLAEMIPDARLEIVEGAGHLPTLEQPERMIDLLTHWMRAPLVLR